MMDAGSLQLSTETENTERLWKDLQVTLEWMKSAEVEKYENHVVYYERVQTGSSCSLTVLSCAVQDH